MSIILAKPYKGQILRGTWEVTLKIDGVRAIYKEGKPYSRSNKLFRGLPEGLEGDYEFFVKDFKTSISIATTLLEDKDTSNFKYNHCFYSLSPLDTRLKITNLTDPTNAVIESLLDVVNERGDEGLVLRQESTWLKVKPEETFDVKITGIIEGKGKHSGMLGAFVTPMGKVGTGFTDKERKDFFTDSLIGTTIEVSCLELTEDNKFRHPRFVTLREDK